MNEYQELTCIVCPVGCRLKAKLVDGQLKIDGQTCVRGEKYALEELTNPTRTVTSSVALEGSTLPLLSVKTRTPVPKASIPAVLAQLKHARAQAPVHVGDIVAQDVAGTGVDIVATREAKSA